MVEAKLKPAQHQDKQPGIESKMNPKPVVLREDYRGTYKLKDKVALITGGDSGIGEAVAYLFVQEGAKVFIVYLDEHEDAKKTQETIKKLGGECELMSGDVGEERFCQDAVSACVKKFGRLDILVNNAAEQRQRASIMDVTSEHLLRIFKTNIFAYFYFVKAALDHLRKGSSIINTTSVAAYLGNPLLPDYSATKGAIVSFTRSLAESLIEKGIRVNGVAPGSIWTPLIPASLEKKMVSEHGKAALMQRPGEPVEVAPCYLFLASEDSSYMTGQVMHPNGGMMVNG